LAHGHTLSLCPRIYLIIDIEFVRSAENDSDLFTKYVSQELYERHMKKFGIKLLKLKRKFDFSVKKGVVMVEKSTFFKKKDNCFSKEFSDLENF
jgi:hypothetical protein